MGSAGSGRDISGKAVGTVSSLLCSSLNKQQTFLQALVNLDHAAIPVMETMLVFPIYEGSKKF